MSSAPVTLARIAQLWRYPVKSMRGQQTDSLCVLPEGIAHDRRYALLSSGAPAGKPRLTSRERAALIAYTAAYTRDGVQVTTPDGLRFPVDDAALLAHLQQRLPGGNRLTVEHGQAGPYTDVRPISLISTQALAALDRGFGRAVDPRRFRCNIVLDFHAPLATAPPGQASPGFPEDLLAGSALQLGAGCQLRLLERIPRCRVVTLDPTTTEADPTLMKHLDRHHAGRLGVYAAVVTPGMLRVGDPVYRFLPSPAGASQVAEV